MADGGGLEKSRLLPESKFRILYLCVMTKRHREEAAGRRGDLKSNTLIHGTRYLKRLRWPGRRVPRSTGCA